MLSKKIETTSNTISIAKKIVNRCLKCGYEIYTSKLEQMMVIAYGEYLIETGKRLFECKIVMRQLGPMIKDFYRDFKQGLKCFNNPFEIDEIFLYDEEVVINRVVDMYGKKRLFHIKDDSRLRALKENNRVGKKISDNDIIEVFNMVPKPQIITHILCGASEKAKWIINACLKAGYDINTYKLEKLLILAYGECLVKTGRKLFNEKIVIWEAGPMIREVDQDFRRYAVGFYYPFLGYHLKLYSEEKIIEEIIYKYGNMHGFELNDNVKLKELAELKNSDGFVSDEDIKRVFEKYIL